MSDELSPGPTSSHEERLADQLAELSDRITRGEKANLAEMGEGDFGETTVLAQLLPAIRMLSELAQDDPSLEAGSAIPRPSDILGDFQLGREIGRGGIGVVYEAMQISLRRRVAIKVLSSASLLDPRLMRRFEIEAQAAAGLEHSHIVPVFACGNERGIPYLAMRRIDGRNLADVVAELRLKSGNGLAPRLVAELGRQAAEALDYAHRHEVLHRDIKPSNFLIENENHLWIADFGLARIRGNSDLTASGDVIGTLRYLSPEQARGSRGPFDCRSDVYALGATLYELLTLRPVFDGDDRAQLLIRIASEEPRFSRTLDSTIPADLQTIVLKALTKDPNDRYATAAELASDLGNFIANRPIRARRPTPVQRAIRWSRQHRRAAATAASMLALLLIILVGAGWWSNGRLRAINLRLEDEIKRADRNADEAKSQARTAERHAFGAQIRLAGQALDAGQPERTQEILADIPLNAGGNGARSFAWHYLWARARREVVEIVGPTPHFLGMGLSADGKLLATSDQTSGLQIRDAATGAVIRDMERVAGRIEQPVLSSDGTLVAAPERSPDSASTDAFSVWDVATGRRLARLPMDRGFESLSCWLFPDRRLFGHAARPNPRPNSRSRLWSLADGVDHPKLVQQFDQFSRVDSDSSPQIILTHETPRMITMRDFRSGEIIRDFRAERGVENFSGFAASKSGQIVAAISNPGYRLTVWNGVTGALLSERNVPANEGRLSISPDGATIAILDERGDVELIDRNSDKTHHIVTGHVTPFRYFDVVFSPDSKKLVTVFFARWKEGGPPPLSIWDVASGERLASFRGRPEDLEKPIFDADGQSLLISSSSGVRRWRPFMRDDARARQPAGHSDEAWSISFSSDGRLLATGSDDSKPDETIKIWETATGQMIRAWQGGSGTVSAIAYSPDGHILVSGHLLNAENVRVWNASTGQIITTLQGHSDRIRSICFDRSGKRLVTAGSDGTIRVWEVETWKQLRVMEGHSDSVHSIAFSPDGKTLASAGNDGNVRIWNLERESTFPPRVVPMRSNLMSLAFSPNGKVLAVADTLGSITICDIERAIPIRLIHSDGDELRQVAFSPDGNVLASAGHRGVIRIWDPVTGQELLNLSGTSAQINALAFSPDGGTLASAAHDGTVHLWRAEP